MIQLHVLSCPSHALSIPPSTNWSEHIGAHSLSKSTHMLKALKRLGSPRRSGHPSFERSDRAPPPPGRKRHGCCSLWAKKIHESNKPIALTFCINLKYPLQVQAQQAFEYYNIYIISTQYKKHSEGPLQRKRPQSTNCYFTSTAKTWKNFGWKITWSC